MWDSFQNFPYAFEEFYVKTVPSKVQTSQKWPNSSQKALKEFKKLHLNGNY